MVKNEKYEPELEHAINSKILSEYRGIKKEFSELDKMQKEEIKDKNQKELEEFEKNVKINKPHGVELLEKSREYADNIKGEEIITGTNDEKEEFDKKLDDEKDKSLDKIEKTNEVSLYEEKTDDEEDSIV